MIARGFSLKQSVMAKTKPGKKDLDSYNIKGTNKSVRRNFFFFYLLLYNACLYLCVLLMGSMLMALICSNLSV